MKRSASCSVVGDGQYVQMRRLVSVVWWDVVKSKNEWGSS